MITPKGLLSDRLNYITRTTGDVLDGQGYLGVGQSGIQRFEAETICDCPGAIS